MLSSYLLAVVMVGGAAASLRLLPPLHPIQLWCLPWAAAATLFCLRLLPMKPVPPEAAGLVVAATVCFSIGALVAAPAYERLPERPKRKWKPLPDQIAIAAACSFLLLVVAMAVHLGPLIAEHGLRPTLSASPDLKSLSLQTENPRFLYFAIAAAVLTAVAAARAPDRRTGRLWGVACGIAAASPYFASGRGAIVYLLAVAGIAYLLARPAPPSMRQLIVGLGALGVLLVAVTMVVGALQNRGFTETSDIGAVPSVFRDHESISQLGVPYAYATLPLSALGEQVEVTSTWGESEGCASMRMVCSAMERLGAGVNPVDPARPFTRRPMGWNLYTALDLPLLDGGIALAPLIMGLTGFVLGLLWFACRDGLLLGLLGYPVIVAACVNATAKYDFASQYQIGALIIALLLVATARFLASSSDRKVGVRAET